MVRRRYSDIKVGISRLEAVLALHLRCAGYHRKQVEEEMQRYTLPPIQTVPLVTKLGYLQRMLDYAFGAHGDIIIGMTISASRKWRSSTRKRKLWNITPHIRLKLKIRD